ncbi:MAG TPA: IS1595 family transposase, partial [Bryobacteraceae bacterium]|nr:IS1595 family transposase [Bryobacteraceae bacterium]
MNLIETTKKFGDQESCVNYLEAARWPDGVQCLKCDSPRVARITTNETESKRKDPRTGEVKIRKVPARIVYQCYACGHQFSATTGTIFHDTHLDLEKWFLAVALMTNAKKGLSALQMKRDLKVAYKTAWYLNHRIREAMALLEAVDEKPLTGTVEV